MQVGQGLRVLARFERVQHSDGVLFAHFDVVAAKQIYIPGKRSYIPGLICKLFHFALSLKKAIAPERVA